MPDNNDEIKRAKRKIYEKRNRQINKNLSGNKAYLPKGIKKKSRHKKQINDGKSIYTSVKYSENLTKMHVVRGILVFVLVLMVAGIIFCIGFGNQENSKKNSNSDVSKIEAEANIDGVNSDSNDTNNAYEASDKNGTYNDDSTEKKENSTDEESLDKDNGSNSNKGNNKDNIKVIYPTKSNRYAEITSAEIVSPYISVISVTNNTIVAGRNVDTRIYPASMTKVMTLIVAVENIKNMNDTFTMTSELIDPLVKDNASRAGFDPGEEVNAKDLLYGLILPSGADSAVGLSNMVAGSETEFVNMMNEKCEQMGLKNTHFMNTSGLHDENHYTTPIEMAMILEYAMKNPVCAEILSTYQYTTVPTEKHPEGILLTSTMFSRMYGDEVEGVTIKAGKTGYTQESKHCLVSYAVRGNDAYVAVTAGADNKWGVIYDDFAIYKDYTLN